ncbi:hypothetical protein BHE74_00046755 [Ensete ventricosum]|nr:hypothetical protein BHE74_00046755 [Ensete ventricosum]RZS16153.1 hypothetical protein BHM03_00048109 [Ensete ventricosum]
MNGGPRATSQVHMLHHKMKPRPARAAATAAAMARRISQTLFILFFLLILLLFDVSVSGLELLPCPRSSLLPSSLSDCVFAGRAEIEDDPTESPQLFSKVTCILMTVISCVVSGQMQTTRALVEYALDYDYGGHNPKHEPRRGKPGTGSRNP